MYNLIDILLVVGLIISIVGIILLISYFVDSNADRTTNMIKEFLESKELDASSLGNFERKSNKKDMPLKIRRDYNDYDEYNDLDYEELVIEDYPDSTPSEYYGGLEDNPKAVLNVVQREERDLDLDKQLVFTPNYGKPLKVTRTPKKRQSEYYVEEIPPFVVENDKTDEIRRALEEPAPVVKEVADTQTLVPPKVAETRDIKIDINDPESLPVPKSLKSYVIIKDGLVTSQEAFDQLATNVNKEIMLEIPSLNDLSDRFLSHVPTIYSRVIIDEFDVSDMSYMFLISSLLKQGVHIKTVPKVHTVNLITDDSHAMIISEGQNDIEYGAVYDDRNSISNIRADFEKTWNLASNLDESILFGAAGGAA